MAQRSRPTLHDVASHSGISKSTISRVLNDHPSVSPEARRVVLKSIAELGYRTNDAARALRTNSTRTVALVVATLRNEVFAAIGEGLGRVLADSNRTLVVATTAGDPGRETAVVRSLLERGVDGLLISLADERSPVLEEVRRAGVPTVVLDRDVRGGFVDHVLTDHNPAIRDAVSDLRSHGHDRIALVCSTLALRPGREVKAAFEEAGGSPDLVVPGPLTEEFGVEATEGLLLGADPPSALIASGTQVLVGALRVFGDHGLRIPQDMSLIAYDRSDASRIHRPPLSLIVRDREEIGELAGRAILERLDGRRTKPKRVVVFSRYEPHGSVTAARTLARR